MIDFEDIQEKLLDLVDWYDALNELEEMKSNRSSKCHWLNGDFEGSYNHTRKIISEEIDKILRRLPR